MEKKKGSDKNYSTLLFIITFIILGTVCSVLYYISINKLPLSFVKEHKVVFFWIGEFILTALFVASVVFAVKKMSKMSKLSITVYVLLLLVLILMVILVNTNFFTVIRSVEDLKNYIEQAGKWMWGLFIVIQFSQVVLLPIPGMLSTTVGLALFGPWKCFLFSMIGIISGSLVAFIVGRKLGYKAVVWLVGEEDLKKWMEKLKGKDTFVLTIMFLFPLFPDDMLCFVAGLSSMSFKYFVIMTVICRAISIATTCFSLNFIPFNTWWGLLIWACLIGLVIAAFVIIYKNLDKIQEKINKIKK